MAGFGDFTAVFIRCERIFADRFAKIFSAAVLFNPTGGSGGFENQSAAVIQMDFGCLPCLAYFFATFFAKATKVRKASKHTLVVAIWIGIGWIPGTVEPVACGGDSRLEDTRQKTKRAPRRSLASTLIETPLQAIHSRAAKLGR